MHIKTTRRYHLTPIRMAIIRKPTSYIYVYFLVTQMVKNPPAVRETQVQSVGLEDPLEKRMAAHSSILAWRIPWTEEPDGL